MGDDALGHLPVAERSKINYGRKMLSKEHDDRIRIVKAIPPGEDTFGCIACCHAPSCCALLSLCPCCTNPEYIIHKRASSKYIYIRENSIEWNDPEVKEFIETCSQRIHNSGVSVYAIKDCAEKRGMFWM